MPPGEPNPGAPNGTAAELQCGGEIVLDLDSWGGTRVTSHAGYDLIYYERPGCTGICLDWVIVDVCDDPCVAWQTVFNWGDGAADGNTNVAGYAAGGEDDNEPIPLSDLHLGSTTGIEIDVDFLGPVPLAGYRYIRVRSPINWPDNDGSDIDSIEVLP